MIALSARLNRPFVGGLVYDTVAMRLSRFCVTNTGMVTVRTDERFA